MNKSRLEAFSDGVIAILITIMVFEIKAPEGTDFAALRSVAPSLLTFLLSFIYLGIYWSNHHHMLQLTQRVNGSVLWANLHLLFWLSLFPFTTAWLNRSQISPLPVALYGAVLLFAGIAYVMLQTQIIKAEGEASKLRNAVGADIKGKVSMVAYFASVVIAWWAPVVSVAVYIAVAILWLVPDKRIEQHAGATAGDDSGTVPR